MKKDIWLLTVIVFFVTVSLTFTSYCIGADATKKPKYTLRLGHCVSDRHAYHLGSVRLAELVKEYTGGEAEIKIYPNFQLGTEQVQNKNVQMGTQDMSLGAINNLAPWYAPLNIFMQPYIFRDREHAFKVADGSVGQSLREGFIKATGMRLVTFFEYGWRCIANNKRPINKVDDFKGILVRVPKNAVMIDTYNALGAQATPIAWGETFNALQQGVVDGFEGTPPIVLDLKFYEVIKYLSLSNTFYGFSNIVINEKTFQKLPQSVQDAILRAAKEAENYQRELSIKQHNDAGSELNKKGVIVNNIDDLNPFRQKVQKVWTKYESQIGKELFDAVVAVK